MPDVLNPDVHPLLDVAVANDLVDDDTDGIWCHVVDNTSSPSCVFASNRALASKFV